MTKFSSKGLSVAWSEEYKRKGIPSSFRKAPTQALVEFIVWYQNKGLNPGNVVDIGCGQGRNSFYLANKGFNVTAIDLLSENANFINNESQRQKLPIQAFSQDVSTKWPVNKDSLDLAVDIFCYKHIVEKEDQKRYRTELWRTLKPNGYYFISLASEKDGFYGSLLANSLDSNRKLIVDPYSKIPSLLYSLDELILEFSDLFCIVETKEEKSTSPMYGKEYRRVILNCTFQKRP